MSPCPNIKPCPSQGGGTGGEEDIVKCSRDVGVSLFLSKVRHGAEILRLPQEEEKMTEGCLVAIVIGAEDRRQWQTTGFCGHGDDTQRGCWSGAHLSRSAPDRAGSLRILLLRWRT